MREFIVGLLVLLLFGVLTILRVFLFPLFLVMGLFLKLIVGFLGIILVIWVTGKLTLVSIENLQKRKESPSTLLKKEPFLFS